MTPVETGRGDSPLVLGLPHAGTWLPPEVRAALNARGRGLEDTDWHVGRLYDGLLPGVTSVRATFHRYVIDANRDPDGSSLYPGQNSTGLVPLTGFDGLEIWQTPPSPADIAARLQMFHAPYHAALAAEMARVHSRHGMVILLDCHSIRSRLPFLFDGVLPDFNIGTNKGTSCAPALEKAVQAICAAAAGYTSVLNGRFKGGWTTRHYGRPQHNYHAIQLELAQSAYLASEAAPWSYDEGKAARLRPHLREILARLADLAASPGGAT